MGPLHGYRIVEMGSIGPVPYCGMLLADMGADVVRLDRIGEVDLGIKRDPRFDLASRGKRSIAINLKSSEGHNVAMQLLSQADAVIEGFRPGVMERLGLGPDVCLERNKGLVYGRLTGWGQEGPLAKSAGHDMNFIAITGALDAFGIKGGPPVAPLNLLGDFAGGSLFLALGVACALVERAKSGLGQVVDAAIVDGVTNLMASVYGQKAGGLWQDDRGEHISGGAAPWNTVYETLDGRYITVCSVEERFYAVLTNRLGIDATTLPDRMDRANWPYLQETFAAIFRSHDLAHWRQLLEGSDACFAPVLTVAEAPEHVHVVARRTVTTIAGVLQPNAAPRMSRTLPEIQGIPVASPGMHSREVLAELGWGNDDYARLQGMGAVA